VSDARARLFDIIKSRSVLTGGDFKLAGGGQSSVFFDMKMTLLTPTGLDLASRLLLDLMGDDPVDAVAGLVLGACPLVDGVSLRSLDARSEAPIRALYVRKEPKDHGTTKLIEGEVQSDWHVVVLEDVTTKGGSSLKAVEQCRQAGCTVDTVLTVVDRQGGATERMKLQGVELRSLFTMEEFV
jgi:orotate phosphoribosyltransferase